MLRRSFVSLLAGLPVIGAMLPASLTAKASQKLQSLNGRIYDTDALLAEARRIGQQIGVRNERQATAKVLRRNCSDCLAWTLEEVSGEPLNG